MYNASEKTPRQMKLTPSGGDRTDKQGPRGQQTPVATCARTSVSTGIVSAGCIRDGAKETGSAGAGDNKKDRCLDAAKYTLGKHVSQLPMGV